MSVATRKSPPIPPPRTVADLLKRLGVPASRILLDPAPGTATEADVIRIRDTQDRLCELVEGVLVEKAMGYEESELAVLLIYHLVAYLRGNRRGKVAGADAATRLFPGLIRVPDVAFSSWERRPKGKLEPIPSLVPDLAVEILSPSNRAAEMKRKLAEYRKAGVRLIWYVDPRKKTATIFPGEGKPEILTEDGWLDGGDVLPGFRLSLRQLFAEAEEGRPETE